MRLSILLSSLPLALGAPQPSGRNAPAPLLRSRDVNSRIAGAYIVKFKDDSALAQLDNVAKSPSLGVNIAPDHIFSGIFNGFSANLDKETLDVIRDHPDVEFIEEDAVVTALYDEQVNAPWGLARLSSRTPGATSYFHYPTGGTGSCAYVIDTGIDASHPDFEGRAAFVANFAGGSNTDGNGHGTHIAGIIGGKTYGVAKKASVYGIKALGDSGSGTIAGLISAINFVPGDAASRGCPNGAYINLSIGGGYSAALNSAVASSVQNGIFVGVAAGSSNTDAANTSPASEPLACTVGGIDRNDQRTNSNYGPAIDIFAPGRDIISTWPGGGTNTLSGTSMAAPHVVGLAAYLGSVESPTNPGGLCARIVELATRGVLGNIPAGTVNLVAFNGYPDL